MAAHRYWRAVGLEAYAGGDIELSEFHLLAGGVRVDATATLTANIGPDTGSLASLSDDDTSTAASWLARNAKTLVLTWDFGVATEADDIRIGAAHQVARFPLIVRMQQSDDGITWADQIPVAGIAWPGAFQKTASIPQATFTQFSETLKTSGATLASDNTQFSEAGETLESAMSVTGRSSGKCYWEVRTVGVGVSFNCTHGIRRSDEPIETIFTSGMTCALRATGEVYTGATGATGSTGVPGAYFASADVVQFAFDATAGNLWIGKNGTWMNSGNPELGTNPFFTGIPSGTWHHYTAVDNNATSHTTTLSGFTNKFLYQPPNGFDVSPQVGITRNWVRGRSAPSGLSLVPSLATVETYGKTEIAPVLAGRKDYLTGVLGQGIGRVVGTVKDTPDSPVYRKVRLIRERDGLPMREMWSDPTTGAYDFQYVDELQTYTVVSYDHTKNFRAVIADGLTPELMP